jgi:hypothetical protein
MYAEEESFYALMRPELLDDYFTLETTRTVAKFKHVTRRQSKNTEEIKNRLKSRLMISQIQIHKA